MKKNNLTLLIDDDPVYTLLAEKLLKSVKFSNAYITFDNGKDAIEGYKNMVELGKIPDTILLDLNMPVMDGWQFLDELIKLNLPIPSRIYIVSSTIDNRDLKKVEQYECIKELISKPLTPEKVIYMMES
ncbi:response regulator [Hyunsoonleella pacifica]|uniref:response regulator n=1 Tax=Hyunsoonleella pacifica TaxID=1080224 RepID=UPI0013EEFEC3|nr:response regulator [Hyunsoonleella pacifica]GGD11260.1 response regulator [Hyunsoonleella pacifica]